MFFVNYEEQLHITKHSSTMTLLKNSQVLFKKVIWYVTEELCLFILYVM